MSNCYLSFFQAAVVSILLYGCTTWTLTKRLEKKLDGNYTAFLVTYSLSILSLEYYHYYCQVPGRKNETQFLPSNGRVYTAVWMYYWTLTKRLEKKLDGNCTRMLRAILNKFRRQHQTKHQLYSPLPSITKTIQVRQTRHAGHYWRSRGELISDVLLWTPTYGRAKAGRPARTYIQQLCKDTGCSPEDLPEAMNDREKWRERVRDIRASGTTWWWWWWCFLKKENAWLGLFILWHMNPLWVT